MQRVDPMVLSHSTLIVVSGPPMPGRTQLARALACARRGELVSLVHESDRHVASKEVAEVLARGLDVVLDGTMASVEERNWALALAPEGRAVLVEWLFTRRDAERVRHRYAARARFVEERELEAFDSDGGQRQPVGHEISAERLGVVWGGAPLSDQLLAVEALLEPRPVAAPQLSPEAPRRRFVLVVEDDPDMRVVLHEVLRELGYEVGEVESAEDAVKFLERRAAVDLLLVDQRLPGMSGTELMTLARRRFPSVRTLLVTGYGDDPTCEAALGAHAETVLTKPVRVMDLRLALEEAFS